MAFALIGALLLPILAVPLLAWAGRGFGPRTSWLALPFPVLSAVLIASLLTGAEPFAERIITIPWIPSLGIDLSFVIDGLSLFFGLVVSGMGVLVTLYASSYLDNHYRDHGRFYAYLMLFMASMLGCVFSENLLLLFVFWEMTSITSFLLIGFLHDEAESRNGARMALFTTAGTGLAMLAGVVLLGELAGTYGLIGLRDGVMMAVADGKTGRLTAAFVLLMLGAFGKSAQFPFHFWLPDAMAAPTPVSAYLHSATMVKLGVFFIARVFPLMALLEAWTPLLVGVGFLTMLLGAVFALLSHDLKAVLAYSTVSQLGFLVGYYGMGDPTGVSYDLMHVANHVFYKGCLFMVVGIIDHAAGTRDLRKLGGLGGHLPVLAVICIVAAATMAGAPGTTGFISKEYMLKAKFDYWHNADWLNWYPIAMVVTASAIKMSFSIRIVHRTFLGKMPPDIEHPLHRPARWMLVPPILLAACCLTFGLAPDLMSHSLRTLAVRGLHVDQEVHLKIWHGLTREFALSAGIIAAGAVLYVLVGPSRWDRARIPNRLRLDAAFDSMMEVIPAVARRITAATGADRPMDYLLTTLAALFAVVSGWLIAHYRVLPGLSGVSDVPTLFDPFRSFVVVMIAIAAVMVVRLRRWTTQLIALATVGFLLTFYYVLFRAPDLAMTQILVEAATLILVLMLLSRFPRDAEIGERTFIQSRTRRALNLLVALLAGITVTVFTFVVASSKWSDHAGEFYLSRAVPDAKGTNVVNTILVDFRGFDTLMEITVLLIATLGVLGLLTRYRRPAREYEAGPMGPAGIGVIHETEAERERRTDR